MSLIDPRRYGVGDPGNRLLGLAQDPGSASELTGALRALAADQRDADISGALAAAPSQPVYSRLWHALSAAVEKPAQGEGVTARVFAMPWIIVCGGGAAATLPCVLPDVGEVARVLEANGVFGASRNLGLGNALCSIESLESLRPSEVLEWSQAPGTRDLPPAPIHVTRGVEEVHVRFLVGAAIAPAHLPGIVETGANVGQWGTAALRAMATQLAGAGVQVLPMPRPPSGLYTAAFNGRRAGVEGAFNLFMSNAVRRIRMAVGDPSVTLSSHASGELRVTLWTPFDDSLVEGFRWPLHPADDLDEVEHTLSAMIGECRLAEPDYAPGIQPDFSRTGAVLYPTSQD
ncbi:MAG TPA: hypothetical protein VD867_08940 [Burkholderiales bacterium]|nr:hypothetical protein [Burkholderiales bacterium]